MIYKIQEMIWRNKSYLAFNVFIRMNEFETIACHNDWNDIDYEQIKSILDDLVKMTIGLIDEDNYESEFEIDEENNICQYLKQCKVNFKNNCNICFFCI